MLERVTSDFNIFLKSGVYFLSRLADDISEISIGSFILKPGRDFQ